MYAFIIPLTNFSDDTPDDEPLLDNKIVLLEDGIAGLGTTGATMGAYPLWVRIDCMAVVPWSVSAIHASPRQGNAAVAFCGTLGAV